MSRYERGAYEPDEEIRVFDGSEDDEDAEGSRLPLLIVLALLVLAMFAGVVWLAYTQGVARGRTETPVLAAVGPAKAAPANADGVQTPYKGFKIYEQPAPADDEADAVPAASSTPAAAANVPAPAKVPATPSAPPPPRAEVHEAANPALAIKPSIIPQISAAKSPPANPAGPATAPPRPLDAAVLSAGPAPVAPPRPLALAAAPVAAASGIHALQIGAYKSAEDASAAWDAYKGKHSALLAGYSQDVQRADLGDKGVWYRLRIAGFSSKDVADAMCDRLKADGGGCFLAK